MQEMNVLGNVRNVSLVSSEQRVLKRDVYDAVAVFDIENYCISAHLAPVLDNLYAVVASSHQPGKVDRAHFEVFGHWNGFFSDGVLKNSRNRKLLPGFQERAVYVAIGAADCIGKFRGGQIRSLRK